LRPNTSFLLPAHSKAHLYRKETDDQRKLKQILALGEETLTKQILVHLGRLKADDARDDVRFFWRFLHTKLYPGLFRDYKACLDGDADKLEVKKLMKIVTPSDEAMVLTIFQVKLEDIMADLREEEDERQHGLELEKERREREKRLDWQR
jgi:hypothetical protein